MWYAVEWIIRIGALIIVPLRRSPAATRAWLLLIFFLPVPGLILFLAIGTPRFPAWRIQRFHELESFYDQIAEQMSRHAQDFGSATPIAALAMTLGRMPATEGNTVVLIDQYDEVIASLVADIEAAATSINLLVYIFADDLVGRPIIDALGRAVARGVRVRVMFDAVGSRRWRRGTSRQLRGVGVEVREALPLHLLSRRTRRDMRNHRKVFVIDDHVGYIGSLNLVAKDFRPGIVNRELVARVTGPAVASMVAVVTGDWCLETGEKPDRAIAIPSPTGGAQAQLLPSGANYPLEGFETLLVWQLHQARHHVTVVTPYFIPDEDVLAAMRIAVARGVTIDLIVSKVIDQPIVSLSQSAYYDDLLAAGVCVHQFRDELLHAKSLSIDSSLAVLGSSNVDMRSFQLNEEVSLLLHDAGSIAALKTIQQGYLNTSDALDLDTWRLRPAWRKIAENVARLASSLF